MWCDAVHTHGKMKSLPQKFQISAGQILMGSVREGKGSKLTVLADVC